MTEQALADIGLLMSGLSNSLLISAIGIVFGTVLGLGAGALRFSGSPVLSQLSAAYVNLFRCTPLLVQIVMLYFALPDIGVRLSPFWASCLALTLWGGAYQAEVFRAGFASVPTLEIVSARALGMTAVQAFLYITLPIGLRTAIPAASTTAITQFRSSSFMIVIGFTELTYMANRIVSETFKVFEIFAIASLMYLVVSMIMSFCFRHLEHWLSVPGSRKAA